MASPTAEGAAGGLARARGRARLWRRFQREGIPWYLARHYWWAYLWRAGVRFWDHPRVINAVLFGQYRRLMDTTLRRVGAAPAGRTLQLTCVYGTFALHLARAAGPEFYLMDVAGVQLEAARRKLNAHAGGGHLARMDAEALAYADACFDTIVIFFLLHELPDAARRNVLAEAVRVARPGARLIVTEYGPVGRSHALHRRRWLRRLLAAAEPFLPGFWVQDLDELLTQAARHAGRSISGGAATPVFGGFYRVTDYRVGPRPGPSP